MPEHDKSLSRYTRIYSRVGFFLRFKPLIDAEMRLLLAAHPADFGISADPTQLDAMKEEVSRLMA